MGKRIWIVNFYTSNPTACSNPRYKELSKHFMDAGYDVIYFNSSKVEKEKFVGEFVERSYGDYKCVHVKAPEFVGNEFKRIKSIWSWAWWLYRNCKKFPKPDIVLHNLHTPFDYPILWMAKRLNAKYIAEAWDLWPEAFVRFGLVSSKNPIMKLAFFAERKLYERADQIIFTLEGVSDYLRSKGWTSDNGGKIDINKIHYINNGINLSEFDSNVIKHPRPDTDINTQGIYKIIYLGSIRLANNVKLLIDAAALLKDNPKYKFFLYGDGNDREMLEQLVREKHIDNVIFKEKRIPLEEVAWVVSQATVNILNYQKNVGLHGISSGKMFQYFAAGKPICCNVGMKYSMINNYNLGIDVLLDTPEKYAAAIRKLAEQPLEEYNNMCARVRKAGEDFDYAKLAAKEIEVLRKC
ncbi:glycosyltransferase family 4 protein [Bacteroides pyogenes]|jgi:glycosyltransferase involved in cell wall biosynthesis|uniref:Glycosyltransferase family 4 protein n=1 Tax=Bacteroides pyogenes TaxID=310300 RepID=A0A5D3FMJ0_9BACE|nr:glycosyltransferase family 4 protein [Bacteroides pyogenes]MCI7070637.1 glycosyltransferase family 4 protein [Bacteroides pyogenes]TYK32199.1 glycosyltransferase family 4 protein [Bacteroides pyogenes]TYK50007.1 glycosyltransferase family 4 protein [Bacteroides pyogenes]